VLVTLVLAVIGTVLGILNLLWMVWTWRGSGSRVQVKTSFRIFPALAMNHMTDIVSRLQVPPEAANVIQQMTEENARISIPVDLDFPASAGLIEALPPEIVMVVATITNNGRLPVTIQRCQWRTSQPGLIEVPNMAPGVSFSHRLAENDRCISIISLATIMSVLDAPLRDKSLTGREAWPIVEVANLRRPIRGNSLIIPTRSQPPAGEPATP
jgi:hypothetical protein